MPAFVAGRDDDRVDQSTQLCRFCLRRRATRGDCGHHGLHPRAVQLHDLRLQRDHRRRGNLGGILAQPVALLDAPAELGSDIGEVRASAGEDADEPVDNRFRELQLAGSTLARTGAGSGILIPLLVKLAHEQRYRLGGEQLRLKAGKNAGLHVPELHPRPVIAGARFARAHAAEPRICDDRHGPATAPAAHQPGKDVLRPAALGQGSCSTHLPGFLCG